MTKPENFLGTFVERWSRRKHAATQAPAGVASARKADEATNAPTEMHRDPASDPGPPPFDPASLPPIESINAASDVRAFLAPGVPVELARAALRRAWTTDPAIRDFVGIAENQWDFTQPDGIPGFGQLKVTEELRRAVLELCGDVAGGSAGAPDQDSAATKHGPENIQKSTTHEPNIALPTNALPKRSGDHADPVRPAEAENAAVRDNSSELAADQPSARRHGRALPQ
ncbi:MAG TPA: DUF3306 domain-containing protein [Xanthobacteraceae bacterium]|nr:DUF3306 domain-containing protein [Xanthobacteraceae bacterium]